MKNRPQSSSEISKHKLSKSPRSIRRDGGSRRSER